MNTHKQALLIEHGIGKRLGQTLYVQDAGHGWFMVSCEELKSLGIAEKVSTYSYLDGEYAFLEEDCDAGLLIEAREKRGIETVTRSYYDGMDSVVRDMKPFTYDNAVRAGLV